MKANYILIALMLGFIALSSKGHSQDEFPVLEGPYMGQKPPGTVA